MTSPAQRDPASGRGGAPLSILHVYKDYFPVLGGMENHVRDLAEAQAAAGHRVTVLVAGPGARSDEEMHKRVRVVRVGRLGTVASTPLAPGFFTRLPRLAGDVVHLHFPHPPGEVAWLVSRAGRRLVVTYQSDVVRQRLLGLLLRPLARRLLDRADAIVATTEAYARGSPLLAPRRGRTTVIPLGVDVERFSSAPPGKVEALRARLLPGERAGPVLLFVGRLRYYKGLDVLLRALVGVPEARLLVVGSGPEGRNLAALARELRLEERVVRTGDLPDADLPACHRLADVFVLPSTLRAEAYGLSMVEAMASGLPVVSTELGTGTSWINRHGETGLVVPPSDPGALASALRGLLADPALRARFGSAARERARSELDRETMVGRVEALYRSVLAAPAARR